MPARFDVWLVSFALLSLAVGACSTDDDPSAGDTVGPTDTSATDTAAVDTATGSDVDSGDTHDASSTDTGSTDTGSTDTTGSDTTVDDTAVDDTAEADTAVDDMPMVAPPIPTGDATALEQWLAAGHHRQWPGESAPHASSGPHFGTVRTFVDPTLEASLAAGNAEHPAGAAAVKELYGDGTEVLGYSVEVKLADTSAAGDNWYWYERYQGSTYADGNGAGICTGCHSGGADFVLTPYPLQ